MMADAPLKVLHLSNTDAGGGASRAASRLHRALRETGIDSLMLVGQRSSRNESVVSCCTTPYSKFRSILWPYLDSLPRRLYPALGATPFSPAWFSYCDLRRHPLLEAADVISLYWINGGFLKPESLQGIRKPVVWRLSDMWPFTGGCHYSASCVRYREQCGSCPILGSHSERDISRRLWKRKAASWKDLDLTVVAPSRWIADCARQSSLFGERRIEIIPTGVDLSVFRPIDRTQARALLGLPPSGGLILFGAFGAMDDRRKGFAPLREALEHFRDKLKDECRLVVFGGASEPPGDVTLPLPAVFAGGLADDVSLALLYSACDVLAMPSLEDNLPNVALEAIACGTPLVAFDIGGMPDTVTHGENGYLARSSDPWDFAEGIRWCLEPPRRSALRQAARARAEESFSLTNSARRYGLLYRELTGRTAG